MSERADDVVIVGSGPAGAMAAWALRGRGGVRMLDVGHAPETAAAAETDAAAYRIGARFEGLRHLRPGQRAISLKLRAPALDFVTRDADRLTPVASQTFQSVLSLAKGGFGNAWGAGVYRFTEDECRGLPISAGELTLHYDEVSRHIGVSGAYDDLADEFGREPELQPPLPLSENAATLLQRYEARRGTAALAGVRIGRARLAVLTAPHGDRPPYAGRGTEFYEPGRSGVYNPSETIDALRAARTIDYEPGWLVRRYRETADGVEVDAERLTGEARTFSARRLILAAGAINSARIVLASARDYETRLPLLDNPITIVAGIHRDRVGRPAERGGGFAQLNMVLSPPAFGRTYQGSVYGAGTVPIAEFLARLPFTIPANRRLLTQVLPAVSIVMMFHPADPSSSQYLRLRDDGVTLEADYAWRPDPGLTRRLVRIFRALGLTSHAMLSDYAGPGQGIHYAGTLPLAVSPQRYQLHADGRLEGTRGVYVCDGSCFPHLPAKNLTFTIMANAHRIASGLAAQLPAA